MTLLRITALRRCGAILVRAALAGGVAGMAAAQTPLADQPVFSNTGVPGNLVLALSVEFPTAISVAHQGNFVAGTRYLGYFDPAKCYRYHVGTQDGATGNDVSHFYPVGNATTAFKCTTSDDTWSGSFMNWLTMQAIDPFRWALTGGYRRVDTTTTTILERAWATNNSLNGGDTNFPLIPTSDGDPLKRRQSPSSTDIADHTPLNFSSIRVSVRTRGTQVWFTKDAGLDSSTTGTPTHYTQGSTPATGALHMFYARVKVCDSSVGLESNCRAYPTGSFKPEGLLQQYADRIRFSAFGYLNDPTDATRDGGVLRARQKFVGPTRFVPGSVPAANSATEWDALTGVQITNPDSADALATSTSLGVTVTNSGVINYLNKFGQEQKSYKRRDPVSELYYGALRYLRNIGHVPAWSDISGNSDKVRLVDGFPVITNWEDPLLYSCQRNFVLGIGDTNTNWDRNVPGSSGGSNEPGMPSQVSSDTAFNAVTATNKVGVMQGNSASLGTAGIGSGSYLIAGMAWDANTRDIRPDDLSKPQTTGKQTVRTYWLDVLEFGSYVSNNQYYLAAKFGGFDVPENFNPNTHTGDLPQPWWRTNTDTVGGQPRPNNYYTVSRPDQMVDGLQRSFADIASQLQAFTTSFSTALPQVALEGVGSYASRYDSGNWTGEITASNTSFDPATGAPTQTAVWNFGPKLAAQIAATGPGWDTGRKIITWNTSSSQGVPFRSTSISAAQLTALDTVYRTGNDSGDYLNYLRGDATHETNSTATSSAKAYRSRTGPVGDIVGSKAKPVGAPAAPFSAATNPGYPAFRTAWQNRAPMLYVGTNAGMLHGIKASVTDADGGREVFAYVPGGLFQGVNGVPAVTGLQQRGNPDFVHKNMIDGPIAVFDIDLGKTQGGTGTPTWRSVLVGAMGKGGKGYFAIDVTDPSAFNTETEAAARVMWEFTDTDLGYTYGEPAAVKTRKYGWVLIFGSGHNNANGIGYIFIVNPRNGALLEKISTGVGTPASPAGLSQVQAYLPDRTDFTAESVYAGDLMGNLWRLDLTPATGAYASPTKIAELTDAAGAPVPVTSRPLVVIQPRTNRRYVTVGSGRLLANSDVGNTQPQGFYAIIDGTGNVFNTASTLPTGMNFPIRNSGADNRLLKLTNLTQTITLNFATQIGWRVDLGTATGGAGWRVISDSTSFLGTIAFAAMVPSGDVCTPSGKNRVYAIDLGTGQSVLRNGEAIISFNDSLPGVITDLRFYSVNGKPRLVGGTDTGATGPLQGSWPTGTGVRRLNWRELQLAD